MKKTTYPKNWKKISRENLKGKYCDICKNQAKHLHHKNMIKSDINIENLIPLCASCHAKIHTLERFYKNNHAPKNYEVLKNEIKAKM